MTNHFFTVTRTLTSSDQVFPLDDPPNHVFIFVKDVGLWSDQVVAWIIFFANHFFGGTRQVCQMTLMKNGRMCCKMLWVWFCVLKMKIVAWPNFLVRWIFVIRLTVWAWSWFTCLLFFFVIATPIVLVLRFLLRFSRPLPLHSTILKPNFDLQWWILVLHFVSHWNMKNHTS